MMRKLPVFIESSRQEGAILAHQASVDHHPTLALPKRRLPLDTAQAIFSEESWLVKEAKELQASHLPHHSQISKVLHIKCPNPDPVCKAHLPLRHPLSKVEATAKARHRMATLLNLLHPLRLLAPAKALA
jgi:hypothetical protein